MSGRRRPAIWDQQAYIEEKFVKDIGTRARMARKIRIAAEERAERERNEARMKKIEAVTI